MFGMIIRGRGKIVYLIWATLILAALVALFLGRWSMAFVATGTLVISMVPSMLADRFHLNLPWPFFTGIVLFIFGSLFLGEMFDLYERLWWWDVMLHGTSAIGFGLLGFVLIFSLFEGDRYAAPAWAITFISMCFAVTIGVSWEIFEYFMDQALGLNMQKNGLQDTMWDLVVDMLGGFIGAFAGFAYLKGRFLGGLAWLVGEFVRLNRGMFRKSNRKDR